MVRRVVAVTEAEVTSGRTCVGCRTRAERADLLRVVAVEGQLGPDPARRLPGRGAHLHRNPDCLELATRRRAWSRAFRGSGPLDDARVRAVVLQGNGKSSTPTH